MAIQISLSSLEYTCNVGKATFNVVSENWKLKSNTLSCFCSIHLFTCCFLKNTIHNRIFMVSEYFHKYFKVIMIEHKRMTPTWLSIFKLLVNVFFGLLDTNFQLESYLIASMPHILMELLMELHCRHQVIPIMSVDKVTYFEQHFEEDFANIDMR